MSRYNNSSRGFFSSMDESQYHYLSQLPIPQVRISPVEQAQQWNSLPRSQSVQGTREQTYSPTGSAITTRTSPNTRMVDRSFYSPSNLFQNTYLNPVLPGGSSMLTSDDIRGLNQSAGAEAWSSWNMRSAEDRARNPPRQSNVDFQPYSRIGSDVHKGALPSDEGYYSVQTSQSVLGNEPERSSQDLTIDFMSPMGNMNVASVVSEATVSHIPPDQKSRVSSTRSRKSGHKPTICEYPECKEVFRCPSEYKKHLLKHEKPFTCDELNCKRAAKGFATKNDLIRHKKSVHNSLDLDNKSYRCAGKNCKTKDKIWPRFDNFKQHVLRMHRDEDVNDVIERSKWDIEQQACVPTDDTTMETDLILSGMDKSFPANMHNLSPLDFSLQQDSQNWNLPDWRADSTKEGHQVPETLTEHSPTKQTDGFKKPRPVQRQELGLSTQQTQTSLSDIATNATPKENVSQAPQSKMSHGLSNAPQTKAEQQRVAQKRSVSVPSPANPVDLENLILNIIQKVNGAERQDGKSTEKAPVGSETLSGSDQMVLTKRGMLEASQEILKLINQNSESVQGASQLPGRRIVCPMDGCNVTVNRRCELRKHMKRHKKPYGCTYPVCNKRFGAKSDWKRHENSQHYQLEAFRCAHEVSPGTVCGKHEHREAAFLTHVEKHGLSQENSRDLIERSKIGTNCQGSFWCGFCTAVIKLKEERHKAWDERFRHIAIHFEQENQRIDDWVCAEKDITKRKLLEEKEKEEFNEDDEREEEREFGSPTEEDSDNSPPPAPPPPPPQGHGPWKFRPMETGVPQAQPIPYQSFGPSNIRKRAAATELHTVYETERQKRRRPEVFKYCCSCGSGPSSSLQPACIGCQHEFCGNCGEEVMYNRVD